MLRSFNIDIALQDIPFHFVRVCLFSKQNQFAFVQWVYRIGFWIQLKIQCAGVVVIRNMEKEFHRNCIFKNLLFHMSPHEMCVVCIFRMVTMCELNDFVANFEQLQFYICFHWEIQCIPYQKLKNKHITEPTFNHLLTPNVLCEANNEQRANVLKNRSKSNVWQQKSPVFNVWNWWENEML